MPTKGPNASGSYAPHESNRARRQRRRRGCFVTSAALIRSPDTELDSDSSSPGRLAALVPVFRSISRVVRAAELTEVRVEPDKVATDGTSRTSSKGAAVLAIFPRRPDPVDPWAFAGETVWVVSLLLCSADRG
jgi:hypothetical protein